LFFTFDWEQQPGNMDPVYDRVAEKLVHGVMTMSIAELRESMGATGTAKGKKCVIS